MLQTLRGAVAKVFARWVRFVTRRWRCGARWRLTRPACASAGPTTGHVTCCTCQDHVSTRQVSAPRSTTRPCQTWTSVPSRAGPAMPWGDRNNRASSTWCLPVSTSILPCMTGITWKLTANHRGFNSADFCDVPTSPSKPNILCKQNNNSKLLFWHWSKFFY